MAAVKASLMPFLNIFVFDLYSTFNSESRNKTDS